MTTEQYQDDGWELEEGMFDDFTGVIGEAYFATDAQYGDNLCLQLFFEVVGMDKPNRVLLGCGPDWQGVDNGESAKHPSKGKFNAQSKVGLFISNLLKLPGARDVMAKRGRQTQAACYRGLKLHMKKIDKDYGGEIGVKQALVPVEFLGVDAEYSSNGSGATAAPAAPAPAVSAPAAQATSVITEELRGTLLDLASNSESYESFVDKALAMEGVQGNPKVEALVMDVRAGSIWKTSQTLKEGV